MRNRSLLGDTEYDTQPLWGMLQIFNLYRTALALGFFLSVFSPAILVILGSENKSLFTQVAFGYLIVSLLSLIAGQQKKPAINVQIVTGVLIDILAFTLLMHASRTAIAVFGILMNASIAGSSILTAGRTSIFFAAIASIAVLLEHAYAITQGDTQYYNYSQMGMVGITFFLTAMLGHALSKRIRISEAIASQRSVDLAHLEKVNEYIVRQFRSGIIVVNEREAIILMNSAAAHLLGLSAPIIGGALSDLSILLVAKLAIWRRDTHRYTEPFRCTENGVAIVPQFFAVDLAGSTATVIFLDDVTSIAQQAQQMKLASLGRLTAGIAHEIRNPLAAVSHAAQLLEESNVITAEEQKLITIISQQVERINNVVNNILQLSRRTSANVSCVVLTPWLQELTQQLHLSIRQTLSINITVEPPKLEVMIDPLQLQQVMFNLCENGLRYSLQKTGYASLDIHAYWETHRKQVIMDVIDDGPGIVAEMREHLFEPFFTTENTGTGLGLYLAKELCELNHGHLDYVTMPGRGACFRVTLPMEAAENASITAMNTQELLS